MSLCEVSLIFCLVNMMPIAYLIVIILILVSVKLIRILPRCHFRFSFITIILSLFVIVQSFLYICTYMHYGFQYFVLSELYLFYIHSICCVYSLLYQLYLESW